MMDLISLKKVAEKHKDLIQPPLDYIYELYGFETMLEIIEIYGGQQIYIPQLKHALFYCVEKELKSIKSDLTKRQICKLIGYGPTATKQKIKRSKTQENGN
jgi:hypothetical protein